MKKTSIIAAFAAFALSLSTGFAATKGQEKQFSTADKDGDGSLTKEEFVALKVGMQKKAAEKNNKEFNAKAASKRLENVFAKSDKDGDGKLSADEFYATFQPRKK